jgi:hypothetical protein
MAMIHDEKHELAQDAAMRMIAGAVASIAGHLGMTSPGREAQAAIALLDADVAAVEPSADLAVVPPAVAVVAEPDWEELKADDK